MARRKINWDTADELISKSEKKEFVRDDGYSENLFTPQLDEKKCFQGIIRFLPRPENDGSGVPYVRLYNHGFKELGWYIENCPTTKGREHKCPACESNSQIWDSDEDTARKRGRRTSYFSNILVVSDPKHKENEGKVFIFRYGKTIHDMIMEKKFPEEDSLDEKVHVHDYDKGLNFKLKIKPKKGYNDYSSSQFSDTPTPVAETDEEIDAIDDKLFPLGQIVSDDKFKTYDELKTRFNATIGESTIDQPSEEETTSEQSTTEESSSQDDSEEETDTEESPDAFFENLQK